MTPQREHKRMQRALRTIPVDAVASAITGDEEAGDALWCLVDGMASLVTVRSGGGGGGETTFCDPLVHAQFVRWLQNHPDRVHSTYALALAFVRSRLGWSSSGNELSGDAALTNGSS